MSKADPKKLKKTVAFVASGKGGVGKTTTAVKLAEWFMNKGAKPVCLNADAFNVGLALDSYPALNAQRLVLVDDGEIVKEGFHEMLEQFSTGEGPFVVDIGSNTFRQVLSYAKELDLPTVLADMGLNVEIHAIVAGGNLTADCAESIAIMAAETPWPFIIVLNEHDGAATINGVPYVETAQFVSLAGADRISGVVSIKKLTELQRAVLEKTKDLRMTADEVRRSDLKVGERITHEQWSKQFFAGYDRMHEAAVEA